MLRRWPGLVVVVVILTVTALVVLPALMRQRLNSNKLECLNHLRQLGQFAALYDHAGGKVAAEIPQVIPPGTVPNPELPPDQRLSWVAEMLPFLDARFQTASDAKLNKAVGWSAPENLLIANRRIKGLLCPGAVPHSSTAEPAPTQFVGLAGLGRDAATLTLQQPLSPQAGCFRYDSATPLKLVQDHDGLSNTAMFADVSDELGPWLRGGFSTLRGLDIEPVAKPNLGSGGQFGGNYEDATAFGLADGSAHFRKSSTSPEIVRALFTLAGGVGERAPGE